MKNLFKIGILIFSLSILSCSGNIDKQIVVNQVSLEKEDIIEDKCNVNYSLIDSSKYNYHLSVLEVLSDSNQSLDGKLYTMLMFSLDSNENKNEFNLTNKVFFSIIEKGDSTNRIFLTNSLFSQNSYLIKHLKNPNCSDLSKSELYNLLKERVQITSQKDSIIKESILEEYNK